MDRPLKANHLQFSEKTRSHPCHIRENRAITAHRRSIDWPTSKKAKSRSRPSGPTSAPSPQQLSSFHHRSKIRQAEAAKDTGSAKSARSPAWFPNSAALYPTVYLPSRGVKLLVVASSGKDEGNGRASIPSNVISTGLILPSSSNSSRSIQVTRWSRPRLGIGRR